MRIEINFKDLAALHAGNFVPLIPAGRRDSGSKFCAICHVTRRRQLTGVGYCITEYSSSLSQVGAKKDKRTEIPLRVFRFGFFSRDVDIQQFCRRCSGTRVDR
jgi:hypothetical protein